MTESTDCVYNPSLWNQWSNDIAHQCSLRDHSNRVGNCYQRDLPANTSFISAL